ncbi:hypothetical protein EI94DRAFT_748971 [Lactarius quietus]|nr:hypothetical protein EI94DRAFT_748971 [Lactarius quietus]
MVHFSFSILTSVLYLFCIKKIDSSCSTMGIADPPCSGYIHDEENRSTPTRAATWNMALPAMTGTAQIDHRTPNDTRRRAATTSTVPRARSGWCGFSDFTIHLPGPLGRVLGRC